MSGFKFGFAVSDDKEAEHTQTIATASAAATSAAPANEVAVTSAIAEPTGTLQEIAFGPDFVVSLRCLTSDSAHRVLRNPDLAASDLSPGLYEGGLKLWESSVDLAKFLFTRFRSPTAGQSRRCQSMHGMRILELGCGHGLPGIVCALSGAEVCFQDYNSEALTMLTIPNLQTNAKLHQATLAPARFLSGDWCMLGQLLSSLGLAQSFDLVVSAETIYSTESMTALLTCIKQCLKPGGTAYIAAKTMYFGLDGGSLPFRRIAERNGGATVHQVAAVTDGIAREILELQFAPSAT